MSGSGKVKLVSRGQGRKRDYRIMFQGEIKSATGIWTEEECREFWEKHYRFLEEHGAVYQDKFWAILVAPKSEDSE